MALAWRRRSKAAGAALLTAVCAAAVLPVDVAPVAAADAGVGGLWVQSVSAQSAQTAYGALAATGVFTGSVQVVLVNPSNAVGSPALGSVDTTKPWAAVMESGSPQNFSVTGSVACQSVVNVQSFGFSQTSVPGRPVAWVDVPCADGTGIQGFHVEWDFLSLPFAAGTSYPAWGDLAQLWGYLEFGQVSMVEATMKVCALGGGTSRCATSNEPQQVYLDADKFSSVTLNVPIGAL